MAKTTFSSGVIVTSQWLNGAQQISFDGQNIDWHYSPLGLSSLKTTGPDGLDERYITLSTDQPSIQSFGLSDSTQSWKFIAGDSISGAKVVIGPWNFGWDQNKELNNPANNILNAPRSYVTNQKFQNAAGTVNPSVPDKFRALDRADLVTKAIFEEVLEYALETLVVDNGYYYVPGGGCNNYSTNDLPGQTGNSSEICRT